MAIDEPEIERLKDRKKGVDINLPDKQVGEEPATEKQLSYIRHLSKGIDLPDDLGKWQASHLIDQIKYELDKFNEELAAETIQRQKQGCLGSIICFIVFPTVVIVLCLKLLPAM